MFKNKSFIVVALTVFALSMLLFLTPLDNQIFDLFLRVIPSLTENEKIYVLTLDDASMELAGGFPFRREVMADVIVLLKEMGVDTIAFDLSYLDESEQRFDPDYAVEQFYHFIHLGLIENLGDVEYLIPYFGRDVDEYFAQAIAFTDNTWLTLTFIGAENILDEINIDEFVFGSEEIDRYLAEHIALNNVTSLGDTRTPEMIGVMPAIQKLLSRSTGAGFVNAIIDQDGLRRRVNLLHKYNGDYYGHLTLAALQSKLAISLIEVSNRAIILNLEDGRKIRIPRTQDGSVLLKWPKKTFHDYRYISMFELIQYELIESALVNNLFLMDFWGFLSIWDDGPTPLEYYLTAREIKNEAFVNNLAACENWLTMRQMFFDSLDTFLNGSLEERILDLVGDDEGTVNSTNELFDVCRSQYNLLAEIRKNNESLRGSFIVVGSDATSMVDYGLNTFQEAYPNVGSYAVVANMLLSGEFLNDSPRYVSAIIALLYSLLIGLLISRFDTYKSIITGITGLVFLTGAFLVFFMITKKYIGFGVPLISTLVTFISIMITKFLTASREKAFIHNAFSRYLAPEVISQIINDPSKLNLGGEKREMTAIFTDVQGFASISEKLDPTQLVKLLNRYLTLMSNIIMENQGTIDKYEGDAIIAFFGAPLFNADHPALACRSALAMKAAEKELNKTVVEEGMSPVPLFTRMGINTGDMVVGNMGAEFKMDYTIMGNAVNLAARLEGVNKQYSTGGILISEYTRAKIGDEFMLRRLDRVRVVGVNTPLRLFEVLALNSEYDSESPEQKAVKMWEQAIDLYEQKNFNEASALFKTLIKNDPNDKVAQLYLDRCDKFIENPPPAEWDAIRNLTEK
ncbi:MAG: CHASE2 domain-containing protein [Treponema sp.]|jgi:adenylate cyclase|nr:CHASE2 domain-containing protein [Treponema sp.]